VFGKLLAEALLRGRCSLEGIERNLECSITICADSYSGYAAEPLGDAKIALLHAIVSHKSAGTDQRTTYHPHWYDVEHTNRLHLLGLSGLLHILPLDPVLGVGLLCDLMIRGGYYARHLELSFSHLFHLR
jgi:hypothetical protein